MRKVATVAIAAGLMFALVFALPSANAAPSAQPLAPPLAGRLAENGGPAGYAVARQLDPALGQAFQPADASPASVALGGNSATVSVAGCCREWNVGAVVGEAGGTEHLTATDVQMSLDDVPAFFTLDDLIALMPQLTFTFELYEKKFPNNLAHWGHYVMNFSTGAASIDDHSTLTPPNGHVRLSQRNTSRMDEAILTGSAQVGAQIQQAVTGSAGPGVDTLNRNTGRLFAGYANRLTFDLGSAPAAVTFGYRFDGLTNGQQATVGLAGALAGSWAAGLGSAPTTGVPVSFADQSVAWRQAFDPATLGEIVGTSLEDSFEAAFAHSFSYQHLIDVIQSRTETQMQDDLQQMVTELIAGIAAGVAQSSARIENIAGYEQWYGVLTMDSLQGLTSWRDISESPQYMYPRLQQDLTTTLAAMVKTKMQGSWYDLAKQMSGTATVTKAFTPGAVTSLVATDVTSATRLATVSELRLGMGETGSALARVEQPLPGTTTSWAYATADPKVATVDADGLVAGVAPGATTLTVRATLAMGGGASSVLVAEVPVAVHGSDGPPPQARLTVTPTGPVPAGLDPPNSYTARVLVSTVDDVPVPDKVVDFTWTGALAGQAPPSCTTGDDGACQVTVSTTRAGRVTLTAALDGEPLDGSPVDLVWQAAAPDPGQSGVALEPGEVPATSPSLVTVTLVDAYGNPVTGLTRAALGLASTPAGVTFGSDFAESAVQPGVYTVSATAPAARVYSIVAKPAGVTLTQSLTVVAGPPASVRLTATPTVSAGGDIEATAVVTDAQDNPVDGLTSDGLALDAAGLTVGDGPTALGSGQYRWTLTTTKAGLYGPAVSVAGHKATAPVVVTPGLPTGLSFGVTGSPALATDPANAVVEATARVTDEYGNGVFGLAEQDFTWTSTLHNLSTGADDPSGQVGRVSFQDTGDGSYRWSLYSRQSGDFTVTLQTAGTDAATQPVSFTAGALASVKLAVGVEAAEVGTPVDVTVTVKDIRGNGLAVDPGQFGEAFSSDPAGLAVVGDWTTTPDAYGRPSGAYTAQVIGSAPAGYTLSVAIPGAPEATAWLTLTGEEPPTSSAPPSSSAEPSSASSESSGSPAQTSSSPEPPTSPQPPSSEPSSSASTAEVPSSPVPPTSSARPSSPQPPSSSEPSSSVASSAPPSSSPSSAQTPSSSASTPQAPSSSVASSAEPSSSPSTAGVSSSEPSSAASPSGGSSPSQRSSAPSWSPSLEPSWSLPSSATPSWLRPTGPESPSSPGPTASPTWANSPWSSPGASSSPTRSESLSPATSSPAEPPSSQLRPSSSSVESSSSVSTPEAPSSSAAVSSAEPSSSLRPPSSSVEPSSSASTPQAPSSSVVVSSAGPSSSASTAGVSPSGPSSAGSPSGGSSPSVSRPSSSAPSRSPSSEPSWSVPSSAAPSWLRPTGPESPSSPGPTASPSSASSPWSSLGPSSSPTRSESPTAATSSPAEPPSSPQPPSSSVEPSSSASTPQAPSSSVVVSSAGPSSSPSTAEVSPSGPSSAGSPSGGSSPSVSRLSSSAPSRSPSSEPSWSLPSSAAPSWLRPTGPESPSSPGPTASPSSANSAGSSSGSSSNPTRSESPTTATPATPTASAVQPETTSPKASSASAATHAPTASTVPPASGTAAITRLDNSGNQWTVVAVGFLPGEQVSGTMYSSPLALGQQTADAAGGVSFTWTMPADVAPGSHRVVLTGAQSGTTVEKAFTLGAGSALSGTGSPASDGLAILTLLFLVGGGIAVTSAARRLRRAD